MFFVAVDQESNEVNNGEIKERGGKHWDDVAGEIMTGANIFGSHVEIIHTDHANDSGFLDNCDYFITKRRDDIFNGLRRDDFKENSGTF